MAGLMHSVLVKSQRLGKKELAMAGKEGALFHQPVLCLCLVTRRQTSLAWERIIAAQLVSLRCNNAAAAAASVARDSLEAGLGGSKI